MQPDDPCAAAPSATPTAGTSPEATGLLGLLQRTISKGMRESTKRFLALLAGSTLCLCTYGLNLAVIYQAVARGTVDPILRDCLLGMALSVAALATFAYRKPDSSTGVQP